jgi:NADPH:quinone reductase-like Zn-dependent oxidoreductase
MGMTDRRAKTIRFMAPRECVVEEIDLGAEPLRGGQFLLETEYSVISVGTELANYAAIDPGVFQSGSWNEYPSTPGYGAIGRVVEVAQGSDDRPDMPIRGQRVFAFTPHASLAVGDVDKHFVVRLNEDDDGSLLVLLRLAGVSMTAIRRAISLQIGGIAVVIGLGAVGNFTAQLLQIAGLTVYGIEREPYRARVARKVGIGGVIEAELTEALTNNREEGAVELRGLADIVVEAAGVSALAVAASSLVRYGGQLVLLGTPRAPHISDTTEFLRDVQLRGLTVTGASEWTLAITGRHRQQGESWSIEEGYLALRDLLRVGKLDGRDLISEIVPPSSAPEIYRDLLGAKRDLLGVVFDWRN